MGHGNGCCWLYVPMVGNDGGGENDSPVAVPRTGIVVVVGIVDRWDCGGDIVEIWIWK
jgi:hypothetical protein